MAFITSAVGGAVVGGIFDALGSATDRDQAINNQYSSDVNQASANFVGAQNSAAASFAGASNQASLAVYGAEVNAEMQNASMGTQVATGMFDSKYNVANMQAGYDKFQAEFGDMQDNVYSTMRSLSASSRDAQIQESLQESFQYEMGATQQRFVELGITPNSGMYQAAEMMLRNDTATAAIKETRNTDIEIAQIQSGFMNSEAQQKYFSRAVDFEEGILTDAEKNQFVTEADVSGIAGPAVAGWTPTEQTDIIKPKTEKFLGIF